MCVRLYMSLPLPSRVQGEECPYSHDVAKEKRREICKYFMTDSCTKGDDCTYYHGVCVCGGGGCVGGGVGGWVCMWMSIGEEGVRE